jgi:hypothetical protein
VHWLSEMHAGCDSGCFAHGASAYRYSYMLGAAYFPVTGELFLGPSATNALTQLSGRFWVSQDQRNTVSTRWRYQIVLGSGLHLGESMGAFSLLLLMAPTSRRSLNTASESLIG